MYFGFNFKTFTVIMFPPYKIIYIFLYFKFSILCQLILNIYTKNIFFRFLPKNTKKLINKNNFNEQFENLRRKMKKSFDKSLVNFERFV